MSIIKVQQGESYQFTVTQVVRDVPSANPKYKPSHKFVGTTPDDPDACVFMNTVSAERQLGRLGLTLDTVVGQTIEFAKPGEYVDINRPSGAGARPAPVSNAKAPHSAGPHIDGIDGPHPIVTPEYGDVEGQRNALAALQVGKLETLFVTYEKCFDRALAVATNHLPAALITHEGVAAQAATLFIQASQKGLAA